MADINEVAKQFTDFYYQTFAADRSQLGPLYREQSMLTWENQPIQGAAAIVEKLKVLTAQALPFEKVAHRVLTLDAQPASASVAAILVLVTGQLLVDDGQNVLQYSQMFHVAGRRVHADQQLIPDGGSYFVQNDVFRLVYG